MPASSPTAGPTSVPTVTPTPSPTAPDRLGALSGLSAYLLWGVFPLYFVLLRPATAWEILAHRVLWSLVLCLGILALTRQLAVLPRLLASPRQLGAVGLAATLLAVNWTVYTVAVLTGHVTEASLGYFLNPLVTVALGVVVLRERLRRAQWVAVTLGALAAVYLTIDYGAPPWISLTLAVSFAGYGLLKKRLGVNLTATESLSGEAVAMAPVALGLLVWLGLSGTQTFTTEGPTHALLLASAGLATTVPLLLFAVAARRVPLVTIGLLQLITPVLQLMCGVLVLGEVVPTSRWYGFGLVWVALVVLALDSVVAGGRSRRLARAVAVAARG